MLKLIWETDKPQSAYELYVDLMCTLSASQVKRLRKHYRTVTPATWPAFRGLSDKQKAAYSLLKIAKSRPLTVLTAV